MAGEPQRGGGGPVDRVGRRVEPHPLHQRGPGDHEALHVDGVRRRPAAEHLIELGGHLGLRPGVAPEQVQGRRERSGRRLVAGQEEDQGLVAHLLRGQPGGTVGVGRVVQPPDQVVATVTDPGAGGPREDVLDHLLEPAVQLAGAPVAQGGPAHRQLHHLQPAPADRVAHLGHQRVEHRDEPLHVVPEQGAAHDPQRVAHGQQVQVDHGAVRAHPVRGQGEVPPRQAVRSPQGLLHHQRRVAAHLPGGEQRLHDPALPPVARPVVGEQAASQHVTGGPEHRGVLGQRPAGLRQHQPDVVGVVGHEERVAHGRPRPDLVAHQVAVPLPAADELTEQVTPQGNGVAGQR